MTSRLRNMAASVHARLRNRSRETGEDFQFILQRYAAERLLFRLGESDYRSRFVLKGAMLFALWGGSVYRSTRDLDFTGYGDSDAEAVLVCFRGICNASVSDDGLDFDGSTLRAEPIREESEYHGLRLRLLARLGRARIPMQIDIGFGNAIEPPASDAEYPVLLDGPSPRIRVYPREAVVAEKFHTLVVLGEGNSRMKDLYDLYVIAGQFGFKGEALVRAIQATFKRRSTAVARELPTPLAPRFFADGMRADLWRAYRVKSRPPGAPADLTQVGDRLLTFLGPLWNALGEGAAFGYTWKPGGPWTESEALS